MCERTTTEDSDIVDLEQECQALLINKFVLNDAYTTKCDLLFLQIEDVTALLGIVLIFRCMVQKHGTGVPHPPIRPTQCKAAVRHIRRDTTI